MGISSVNMALGASYGAYSQKLTQATKQALEVLGIPFSPSITEEEGKRLIKAFTLEKQQEAQKEKFNQNQNTPQSDLFEKAKRLAEKVGIQVPENADFQQLLSAIQMRIEQRLAVSSRDIEGLKELKSLSQELAFIQAQSNGSSGFDNTNQALMTSLEMLSEYNKNFLNK